MKNENNINKHAYKHTTLTSYVSNSCMHDMFTSMPIYMGTPVYVYVYVFMYKQRVYVLRFCSWSMFVLDPVLFCSVLFVYWYILAIVESDSFFRSAIIAIYFLCYAA